jgi:hypothetical protein
MRSPEKNMGSVRYRPTPSAPNARAMARAGAFDVGAHLDAAKFVTPFRYLKKEFIYRFAPPFFPRRRSGGQDWSGARRQRAANDRPVEPVQADPVRPRSAPVRRRTGYGFSN